MSENNRPTNASISTMWAMNNCPNLTDFFSLVRQLGFQKIELNHQIDSKMLSQIPLDDYEFSGIHEPCPADISTKELVARDWLISSTDERARVRGVEAVKKSIDLAKRLGAPVVIFHCGTIPSKVNFETKLRSFYKAGKTDTEEYQETKQQLERLRESQIGPRLVSVKMSIHELIRYASHSEIKLGIENRYHFMDIPSIDEMAELLSLVHPAQLGFIYDVGHAQALDQLGFYPHEDWLKRFSSRMMGCHLHDVIGIEDHYAPGLGQIEFSHIANYLPENAFRTVEMVPGNTLAQVKHGLRRLVTAGCIRYL